MRAVIIKLLSGSFIAIAGLLGAPTIIFPYIISIDAIRFRLARDLSAWTDYNARLRNCPRLNLFPYPNASLTGIILAPKIDDVTPMMGAELVEVDLSLIEFIWGRISFSEARIMRP